MKPLSTIARVYIGFVTVLGLSLIAWAVLNPESNSHSGPFLIYLSIAMLASTLKLSLPGITGTLSANFLFALVGILELTFAETIVMGCTATLVQCYWKAKTKPKPVHICFNISSMAIAIAASYFLYHSRLAQMLSASPSLLLGLVACTFFVTNTLPVAIVVSLVENKPVTRLWRECYFWSFPYYLLGAVVARLISASNRQLGWESLLLVVPVIYLTYRSYHLYLGRLENEKSQAQAMAALHLRTIESLALAIDAKDATTHQHLLRMQVYAFEIGRELGLTEQEMEALRAAAILHDVGKLAVPEHIVSKAGDFTVEEFEKMKIHSLVGAEILDRVKFPYPIVPIVRSHHERWDGTGYPDGLKGERIPLGARILAAVDAFDALATHRPYHQALSLEGALDRIVSQSGTSFDPRVVAVLHRRYAELERIVRSKSNEALASSIKPGVRAPEASALHLEVGKPQAEGTTSKDFLWSIAAARQEVQLLFELTQDLGNSLSLNETLSVLAARLRKIIPYESIAFYLLCEDRLVAEYVNGEDSELFSAVEIPLGQGLSGWVARSREPIVNGNPSVEPAYLNHPAKASTLQSALSIPLDGLSGLVGVLTLYRRERNAFSRDHVRILQAINPKLAHSIENALKYRQLETSASTDGLTGLPNARSLFLHLENELARSRRNSDSLSILVCDLDGFKQVNDRFGHLEGNKVLTLVASGLRTICRPYDYVARLGGDEFVLVLPGLQAKDLDATIHRLLGMVVAAGREVCGSDLLSMSVGKASYPADALNAEQLLAVADRAMYKVKRQHLRSNSEP